MSNGTVLFFYLETLSAAPIEKRKLWSAVDGHHRDLPTPRGYETAHPSMTGKPANLTPPQNPVQIEKAGFISVFESFFDSQEASLALQNQLKDQLRKTSTLLQTLQSSGQMIEGLVRGHFRDMQVQYGEKFGSALTDINARLKALENHVHGSEEETDLPSILKRIEALENAGKNVE